MFPAICQKMFFFIAPLNSFMLEFAAIFKVPVTCMIQMSFGPPSKVTSLLTVTSESHLYRPGTRISSFKVPPLRFKESGFRRIAASKYAANMALTATANVAGVGIA
jgi:hypothetical protein